MPAISLENLKTYFSSVWKQDITLDDDIKDNVFSFSIGNSFVAVGTTQAPFPWSDLEGPCATSILWPTATQDLASHDHHLIVTVVDDNLSEVNTAILLTKVTAALLAVCDEALGALWSNASMVVPKEMFIKFPEEVLPHGPPVPIWVDFRVGDGRANLSSGFTSGLEALGLMDIVAVETPESIAALRERLTGLAGYLISNSLVINDGDTVGHDEDESISVIYGESDFGHEKTVMHLKYGNAKNKSKLKFW